MDTVFDQSLGKTPDMKFSLIFTFFKLLLITAVSGQFLVSTLAAVENDPFEYPIAFDSTAFYEHLIRLTKTHPANPVPYRADIQFGNHTEIVDTADRSYQLWTDMIDQANEHIHILTFFIEDDVSFNGLEPAPCEGAPQVFSHNRIMCKLWQAADRGVKVRFITDSVGNQEAGAGVGGEKLVTALTYHPNVDVINFNPVLAYTGARKLLWQEHRVWLWALNRIHAKLMVTDGRRAITGGRNIGANYMKPAPMNQPGWGSRIYGNPEDYKYRDTEVYIEGPGVAGIQKVFLRNWLEFSQWEATISERDRKWSLFDPRTWVSKGRCTQQVYYRIPYYCKLDQSRLAEVNHVNELLSDEEFFPELLPQGNVKLIFIDSAPVRAGEIPRNPLANPLDTKNPLANKVGQAIENPKIDPFRGLSIGERLYIALINNSQDLIQITNPYFILNAALRRALEHALARGVEVQVFTNSYASSNPKEIWQCSARDVNRLMKAGAKFFQWTSQTGMMHAKTAIFDRQMVVVGSFNFDGVSYNTNFESLAIMSGSTVVDQLTDVWYLDLENSQTEALTLEMLKNRAEAIGLNQDFSNAICDSFGALL